MLIHQHRSGLTQTRRALEAGQLIVGFIGGSITDPRPGYNWPEPLVAWLVATFPRARIVVENAAIGATGSELGVFRAKRDLIDRGCHLVFVEFAVNDFDQPTEKRMRTREGLLRQLLATGSCDVVLAYTFSQPMYADMMADRVPATVAEFEMLAAHYQLGSVWMGLHALREVQAGQMRWEEWLPDGLHPQHRGSLSYAQSVISFLHRELQGDAGPHRPAMPPPLNPRHWESARLLPWDQVRTTGPWTVRRWPHHGWIDLTLDTAAPGARLAFSFEGRALSLGLDFGKASANFRYRLDSPDWKPVLLDRPPWLGLASGWYRIVNIADDLPRGRHEFELEVVHGDTPECAGTNFRLGLIGVVA